MNTIPEPLFAAGQIVTVRIEGHAPHRATITGAWFVGPHWQYRLYRVMRPVSEAQLEAVEETEVLDGSGE